MPPIRQIQLNDNQIILVDKTTKILNAADIPASQNTLSKVENWINTTWLPTNITEYQAQVHVFSLNPLRCTLGTWNLGEIIPTNWWSQ